MLTAAGSPRSLAAAITLYVPRTRTALPRHHHRRNIPSHFTSDFSCVSFAAAARPPETLPATACPSDRLPPLLTTVRPFVRCPPFALPSTISGSVSLTHSLALSHARARLRIPSSCNRRSPALSAGMGEGGEPATGVYTAGARRALFSRTTAEAADTQYGFRTVGLRSRVRLVKKINNNNN